MKIMRWIGMGVAVFMGICPIAQADVYLPKGASRASVQPIKSAEEAVSNIPVLNKIARSFLIGDGFKLKLSGTELRIDHMATHSRAPMSHRACMVSMSVASPVAFFGSSMELPLFSAKSLSSGWGMTSFGDYVMHFSKDATVAKPTLGLNVSARF